ncbi:MAG: ferritin family protein [bacterium]|nr:ferritin family protein [bacterium]
MEYVASAGALGALKLAISAEKEGLESYLKYALKTEEKTGKDMFLQLALDEVDHMNLLEEQLLHLEETGNYRPKDLPKTLLEKIRPHVAKRAVKISGEQGLSALDALKAALEHEAKAVRFYQDFYYHTDDVAARGIFGRLVEMEQAHVDLIQAEIDSITGSGYWFGISEITLEHTMDE